MPDLLLQTLAARALVLGGLGWVIYVGLSIAAQSLIGPASLEPDDDGEEWTGADDPCDEWDRARDRQLDADLWPVVA